MSSTLRSARAVLVALFGSGVAGGLAWATASLRADLGMANVALGLAVVAALAGAADWRAGLVTSVVAGLSLNFFHTEPLHSFRMNHGDEVLTVVLLVVVGWMVSAASALRVRGHLRRYSRSSREVAADQLADLAHHGGSLPAVWQAATEVHAAPLATLDVALASHIPAGMVVVGRHGTETALLVPEAGAAMALDGAGDRCVVVRPRDGVGAVQADRASMVSFVDQLSAALADR